MALIQNLKLKIQHFPLHSSRLFYLRIASLAMGSVLGLECLAYARHLLSVFQDYYIFQDYISMAKLILIRHGQSLWNAANKFTGWVDVPLSERGRAEATIASCKLRDQGYTVDLCFTSMLIRAIETAIVCLTECDEVCGGRTPYIWHDPADPDWHGWDHHMGLPAKELKIIRSPALDERYYGDLQGLNKAEMAEKFGEEQVHLWRRSYDVRPPRW